MFCFYKPKLFSRVFVFIVLVFSVSGEKVLESQPGFVQELREAVADLVGEGRVFLGSLAEQQTVLSVQKAFSQVLGVVAESLAAGLNVLLQYMSHFLHTTGIQEGLPVRKVTPEGLIFVGQWFLIALVCYWLISLTFRLVTSALRRALWLLKVGMAVSCFGLILSDHRAGTETMVARLALLVCVCVLLGVGTSGGSVAADKTARLEEQVKILERRLRDMERWTRTEE